MGGGHERRIDWIPMQPETDLTLVPTANSFKPGAFPSWANSSLNLAGVTREYHYGKRQENFLWTSVEMRAIWCASPRKQWKIQDLKYLELDCVEQTSSSNGRKRIWKASGLFQSLILSMPLMEVICIQKALVWGKKEINNTSHDWPECWCHLLVEVLLPSA